ncbi:glycoside hydrolase family 3 N-terminal domain-containing protein [Larkinella punicea]|uniref:beta-N-acetylhexosaminidase n=1 Tax=Larkinella punicea TaxID=2315727 RepID=A0A368JTY3_9BACT|nr:glycoside hydrolase family 3 N-terminal domain-containing protein [Larkinella punicea]RCR71117.1 glycoside hydrolase [Larkinella punicea]
MRTKVVSRVVLALLLAGFLTAFGWDRSGSTRPVWHGSGWRYALSSTNLLASFSKKAPTRVAKAEVWHHKVHAHPVEVWGSAPQQTRWVDSVFRSMTQEQKIGQFFMVATFSNRDEAHYQYIETLVRHYNIGGLIFFQGGPHRQAVLTNRYQSAANIPLLIGIDGEWGLGMRLDSTMDFPKQMTLGAIYDTSVIYRMGAEIGRQCKRLGIHINFAPVSDINSNPSNPVIGNRSFGESRENVALKASAYMKGLQHTRVIATAKHFPGHGDASSDSHLTLPTINRSVTQLNDIDLYPFRKLIADSLMGVVTGHLHVPVVDNTPRLAATLSEKIVTDLLKKELGFRGLVFTDALNMGGIGKLPAEEINLRALMAGNDVLLYPENVPDAVHKIAEAVEKGRISQELIDEKVRKILRAKYWTGLNKYQPIQLENLSRDLNSSEAQLLKQELCEQAVTLVKNTNNVLPVHSLDTLRMASISIGTDYGNAFQKMLGRYAPFKQITYGEKPSGDHNVEEMLTQVGDANLVVVSFHRMSPSAKWNYGVTNASLNLISRLKQKGVRVVVCAFGPAYALRPFIGTEADAVLCAYEDGEEMQRVVPQIIFGAVPAKGVMPVTIGEWRIGNGLLTAPSQRLAYSLPESVGMRSGQLRHIETVVQKAIRDRAFPGCQVLVARKGKVVFDKSFGTLAYNNAERVTDETLYDLASLTKVLATLQAVMLLNERGAIDLNQKVAYYLPEFQNNSKRNMTVSDVLLHQTGLPAGLSRAIERSKAPGMSSFRSTRDTLYSLQVGPNLFAPPALRDSIWQWIVRTPLTNRVDEAGRYNYLYSDLSFVILQKLVERVAQQPLDGFLDLNLYKPLGISTLCFNPLQCHPNCRIAPTEQDTYFRNSLLQGTVHDQLAALQGGLSGHAGLFGDANDIAKILQMNLQRGNYGGKRFLMPGTVPLFVKTQSDRSHRVLGWDKPEVDGNSVYHATQVSPRSFGHTGFTGNVVWVDPDYDLVFIFLSNRVNPSAGNTLINTQKIRRQIHEIIYQSM